ncbi:MAG: hypothetical protein GEU79_02690 [Acidimicrobiia bacterium]|nr:hypothetical protein [Acidimicrobiia bacterium]
MRLGRPTLRTMFWVSAFAMAVSLLIPVTVAAHPSALDTLTIDLLIESDGALTAIDAAVREEDPGFEFFPTTTEKREVALDVIEVLGLAPDQVMLDAEMSERYHEVGFYVAIPTAEPGRPSTLWFDSRPLQQITAGLGLGHLRLSVCPTVEDGSPTVSLDELGLTASTPGQPSGGERYNQRPGCQVWILEPEDRAVSITVPAAELPYTGLDVLIVGATAIISVGLGFLLIRVTRSVKARSRVMTRADMSSIAIGSSQRRSDSVRRTLHRRTRPPPD